MNLLYLAAIVVISFLYAWTMYNVPILVAGIKRLRKTKNKDQQTSVRLKGGVPSISVILPVKNEANVIGRLLNALLNTDYPTEKKEIVIVEDGSTDKTLEICRSFKREHPSQVKIICKDGSDGKPSALMEALKHVNGEIVGVFDADNVPEPDALLRVASHFEDSSVVAVQGRVCAINAEENMLTQIVAHEETVRYEGFMGGKEALGLFVPLNGSCYFVRRAVLDAVGGWDTTALSEDMELAARLIHNGYKIKYASDVRSWQEYPASISGFFKQRTRWFRGTMEVGFKYGKLLKNMNRLSLDTEVTLAGTFVFISCLLGYFIALLSLIIPFKPDFVSLFLADVTSVLSVMFLALAGITMVYTTKPRKLNSLLWVPFLYIYWILQNFIALYSLLQIILDRPKTWLKTEKNGVIANSSFVLEKDQACV
jgi:cellulose synthase/poly-beta-1,6-N-acetylglucosamine synthase-like glycosyltransferase